MESWCDFSIMGELEGMVSRVEGVLRSFLSTLPHSGGPSCPVPPRDPRVPHSSLCHWSAVVAASSGVQYRLTLLLPPESLLQGTLVCRGGGGHRDFGVAVASVCSDPLAQGGAPFLAHCSDAEAEDAALACSLRLKFGQLGGLLLVRSAHSGSDLIGSVERKEARTLLSTAVLAVENVGLRGSTAVVVQVAEPSQGAFIGSAWCDALGAHTALRAGVASIWEEEEEEEEEEEVEVEEGLGSSRRKGYGMGTPHQEIQQHDSIAAAAAVSPSSSADGANEIDAVEGGQGERSGGGRGGLNTSSLILNPLLTYPGLKALFERKLVNPGELLKGRLPASDKGVAAVASTTVALRWRLGRRALNIIAANLSVPPPLSALECVAVWDDKGKGGPVGEGGTGVAAAAAPTGLLPFPLAPTMHDFVSRTSWVGLRWCGEDVVGRELLWGGVVEPTVLQPPPPSSSYSSSSYSSGSRSTGGGNDSHSAIPTPLLLCRACAPSPPYNIPPIHPVYKHSSGLAVLACGLRGAVALEKRGVGSLSRWGSETALLSPLQNSPHPSSSSSPPFTTKLPSPPSSPRRITQYSSSLSSAFSPTPNAAGFAPHPSPALTPAAPGFAPTTTTTTTHPYIGGATVVSSPSTTTTTTTATAPTVKVIPPSPATNATRALSRHLKEPCASVGSRASGVSSATAATASLDVGITTRLESVEGVVEGALAVWRNGGGEGERGEGGEQAPSSPPPPPPLSILSALVSGCASLCVNSLLNPGGGTALYDWLGHLVEEGINVDHGRGGGTWVSGGDGGRERMREWVRDGGMGYTAVCGGYLIEDGFVSILGGVWCLFLRQVRGIWENIEWEEEEEGGGEKEEKKEKEKEKEGMGGVEVAQQDGEGGINPSPIAQPYPFSPSVGEGVLDAWVDGPALARSNLPPLDTYPLALQQHFWVLHQCIYPPTTAPSSTTNDPSMGEYAPTPTPPLYLYPSPPATHAEAMGDLQACSRMGITCPQAMAYLGSCKDTDLPPVRARLSLPIVVSDMAAYKHWAGSECGDGGSGSSTLSGFLLWYFKLALDVIPEAEPSAEPSEEGGRGGVGSSSPWWRLWESVEPCPAAAQRPLFRPNAVAQRTLLHLEDLSPVDVCLQLVALLAWCSGLGKGCGGEAVPPSFPPHPLLSSHLTSISTATNALVEHCASILLPLTALSTGISAREGSSGGGGGGDSSGGSSSSSSSSSDGSAGEDGGREAREAIREEFIREAGSSLDAEITGLTAKVLVLEASMERWGGLSQLLGKCHHPPPPPLPGQPSNDGKGECHPLDTLAAHTSFPSHPPHTWEPPGLPPGLKGMLGGAMEGAFLLSGGHSPGEGEVCRLASAWTSCAPWGGVTGWECKGAVAALLLLCGDAVEGGGGSGNGGGAGAFTLPPPHNVSMLLTSTAPREFIPSAPTEVGMEVGEKEEEEEEEEGGALRHTMLVTVDTGGGSFITGTDDNFLGKLALSLSIQERE